MSIDVLLSFNFAVVFIFMYFRFRQVIPKLIGNVLMNRQNAAARCIFFSLLKLAVPIEVPNHPALKGDALRTEKKIRKIKFGN